MTFALNPPKHAAAPPRRGPVAAVVDLTWRRPAAALRGLTRRRVVALAATALVAVAWWLTLAPRTVGGPLAAVVVDGTSMQPRFHTGDVVVVHREASYHLGQIVAVHVDGGEVIHQLVAGNAATGWRTKGINRKTMDGWTIPNRDVIGVEWLFLPGAGRWTTWVRTPAGTAALFAVAAFFSIAVPGSRRRSRHHLTLGQTMRHAKQTARDAASPAAAYRTTSIHRVEPAALGILATAVTAAFVVDVTSALPARYFALMPLRLATGDLVGAWIATAVGLAGCVVLGGRVFRGWWGTPADRAVARLRERLVPVGRIDTAATRVRVDSVAALERIARISVAPVLHCVTGPDHTFAVVTDDAVHVLEIPGVIDLRTPVAATTGASSGRPGHLRRPQLATGPH